MRTHREPCPPSAIVSVRPTPADCERVWGSPTLWRYRAASLFTLSHVPRTVHRRGRARTWSPSSLSGGAAGNVAAQASWGRRPCSGAHPNDGTAGSPGKSERRPGWFTKGSQHVPSPPRAQGSSHCARLSAGAGCLFNPDTLVGVERHFMAPACMSLPAARRLPLRVRTGQPPALRGGVPAQAFCPVKN